MNLLNPNFNKYHKEIIDAISEVLGEEYKHLIEERIYSMIPITYVKNDRLKLYLNKWKKFKQQEFIKKFLLEIGEAIEGLDINNIIKNYFETLYAFDEPTIMFYYQRLLSFKPLSEDLKKDPRIEEIKQFVLKEQIKFLNSLLKSEEITLNNYEQFKTTNKYKEVRILIDKYLEIFDKLMSEYKCFLTENIKGYETYLEKEKEREKELKKVYLKNVIEEIKTIPSIQKEIIESLENIDVETDIEYKTNFEYFGESDEEKLNDKNTDSFDRKYIVHARLIIIKALGIEIDVPNLFSDEIIPFYEKTIEREEVKKVIPSFELVEKVKRIREQTYENFKKEYYFSGPSFEEYTNLDENTKTAIYYAINNERISVFNGVNNDTKKQISIMFFSILNYWFGKIDYIYLHELIHVSEMVFRNIKNLNDTYHSTGFDIISNERELNPYNKTKRKYERLNETITDIFAIEVRKNLHQKGIYFAEPKDIIDEDVENNNTSSILKNLLVPLLEKAREEIIESRMTGNLEQLYNFLGKENFENLNDVINKIDYLIDQGLEEKLNKNDFDPLVIQYQYEIKRLEEIYNLIDLNIKENRQKL